jgi:hypothetical protein
VVSSRASPSVRHPGDPPVPASESEAAGAHVFHTLASRTERMGAEPEREHRKREDGWVTTGEVRQAMKMVAKPPGAVRFSGQDLVCLSLSGVSLNKLARLPSCANQRCSQLQKADTLQ